MSESQRILKDVRYAALLVEEGAKVKHGFLGRIFKEVGASYGVRLSSTLEHGGISGCALETDQDIDFLTMKQILNKVAGITGGDVALSLRNDVHTGADLFQRKAGEGDRAALLNQQILRSQSYTSEV